MCQLSYANLHDVNLNKQLLLLMTNLGSVVHKDGVGYIGTGGGKYKCDLPAHWLDDSGTAISKIAKDDGALIGHIRQASPAVPVTKANAHPFSTKEVHQIHNGSLTPKDKKKFVTEEEVDEKQINKQTNETRVVKKIVKRSDSLVFFEYFISIFTGEKKFEEALVEAMQEFTGKFALMYRVVKDGKTVDYIVRGKTADLYITFLLDGKKKGANVLGYAINTSKDTLELSITTLSNLNQIAGKGELIFSTPELLTAETIFEAGDTELTVLGEIKEEETWKSTYGYTTASNHKSRRWDEEGSLFEEGNTKNGKTKGMDSTKSQTTEDKLIARVKKFREQYMLTSRDIQTIFTGLYGASITEVDEVILRNFVTKSIPRLEQKTSLKMVRRLREAIGFNYFSGVLYNKYNLEFPWMLNSKKVLQEVVDSIKKGG